MDVKRALAKAALGAGIAAGGFLGALTAAEYRPKGEEKLPVTKTGEGSGRAAKEGETLTLLTWNIGFGCFDAGADFFKDGGTKIFPADKAAVERNIGNIGQGISSLHPDAVFLQEADQRSFRSHGIDEVSSLAAAAAEGGDPVYTAFAKNFNVLFVPYPVPPIGHVESGIVTISRLEPEREMRLSLPCPFRWPVRTCNLKRCLLLSRIPVQDAEGERTGRDLVLVNLHLEAYDDGAGKTAQTRALLKVLERERRKGNYVIAGGDFNQSFSTTDISRYPLRDSRLWQCGILDTGAFGENWQFAQDGEHPSCRSLDRPIAGADRDTFQYYVVDGFIASDNVEILSARTQDFGFASSDHNPVVLSCRLKPRMDENGKE